MEDSFVASDVIKERFERLKEVTDRSALRRHRARVGRREEVLVEGPSRRNDQMLSGRTRQGKLIHFPFRGDAARARVARQRGRHLRRAVLLAGRDGRRTADAAPQDSCAPALGEVSRYADLARAGRPHRLGEVRSWPTRSRANEERVEIVQRRRDERLSRHGLGTAKPTRTERDEVTYHLLDLVEPSEEFTVAQFQRAAREAVERDRAREAPTCSTWAERGSTAAPSWTISTSRVATPRFVERSKSERRVTCSDLYRELVGRDPLAASRIEASNERRVATRAGSDARLGTAVLFVRRRAPHLRARARGADRDSTCPPRPLDERIAARFRALDGRGLVGGGRGSGRRAGWTGTHRPSGRRVSSTSSPPGRRRRPGGVRQRRHYPEPAPRSPSAFVVSPRSRAWSGSTTWTAARSAR